MQIETTMSIEGNEKFPSGNWFWHEWDDSAASVETIRNYLEVARKMKANLLVNVGPDDKGRLREVDVKRLGKTLRYLKSVLGMNSITSGFKINY